MTSLLILSKNTSDSISFWGNKSIREISKWIEILEKMEGKNERTT